MTTKQLDNIKPTDLKTGDIILGGASDSHEFTAEHALRVTSVVVQRSTDNVKVFIEGLGTIYLDNWKPITVKRDVPDPDLPLGTVFSTRSTAYIRTDKDTWQYVSITGELDTASADDAHVAKKLESGDYTLLFKPEED